MSDGPNLAELWDEHHWQGLKIMAGFCRYWRCMPDQYYALTVEQRAAMFEWMAEERRAREQARQRAASRRR